MLDRVSSTATIGHRGVDMNIRIQTLTMFLVLSSGCTQTLPGNADFANGSVQLAVIADQIAWRPCPAGLPPGCEMAVLEGSPREPGLFTARFRVAEGFVVAPHTHPRDERVTVLGGRMAVAFGPEATLDDARQFGPGDYYVNARGAVHTVWALADSEIQVTGLGRRRSRPAEKCGGVILMVEQLPHSN